MSDQLFQHPLGQIAASLEEDAFDDAIALCEAILSDDPACHPAYWYLGLAHLLQGQEAEAQLIWAGAIAEAPMADLEAMTEELSHLLRTVAAQQEVRQRQERAWLVRQHLREVNPLDSLNQLRLVRLGLELGTLTPEDVTTLIDTLEQTSSPVDGDELLDLVQRMLEQAPLKSEVGELAEVCAPYIAPDALVEVLMPAVHTLKHRRQDNGMAYRYASLCHRLRPDRRDILLTLCGIAQDDRRYDEGVDLARQYYATCQTVPERVLGNGVILRGLMNTGTRWEEATTALNLETELLHTLVAEFRPAPDRILTPGVICNPLFYYPYFEDNPETIRPLMNRVMDRFQEGINLQLQQMEDYRPSTPIAGTITASQRPKLRIGYLSHFLYRHSVGWLCRWALEYANRDRFDIFVYFVETPELSPFSHRWFVENATLSRQFLPGDSALTIARAIQADGVDILVELDSLTWELSCHVMALKPAPIQLTWLGLDASGLPTIDYYLADPHLLPAEAQTYYREHLWRLPQTYIAVSGFEVGVPNLRRDDLGIPPQAVVYLTSQFAYKRHPGTMKAQMQILRQVPDSYLLVKGLGAEEEMQAAFSAVALAAGVHPDRLRFLPRDPDEETHRANLAIADVILDTFPYNGATTTLETLWMGIPLVTWVGKQCSARTSYTMMINAGITAGIAHSEAEYIEWGVRLGTDADLRQHISLTLMRSRQTAPLWNARQFTRDLEAAYEQMILSRLEE